MLLEQLREKNDIMIYSIHDKEFKSFGRIVSGYDLLEITDYMKNNSKIPEAGNIYLPSVKEMEDMDVYQQMKGNLYGGMPIQIGYCNGRNTTYNGFEYHKGSEINIAVTDFMLVLGHTWDIENHTYKTEDAKVFFVEKGSALELYQTTLHLSPCRVCDQGFKAIIVLPKGTNIPFDKDTKEIDTEDVLLLHQNKWVIAHKDREPLIKQGAYPGLIGENKELFY